MMSPTMGDECSSRSDTITPDFEASVEDVVSQCEQCVGDSTCVYSNPLDIASTEDFSCVQASALTDESHAPKTQEECAGLGERFIEHHNMRTPVRWIRHLEASSRIQTDVSSIAGPVLAEKDPREFRPSQWR